MSVVAVFPHLKKEAAIPAAHRLTEELVSRGYDVVMIEGDAKVVGLEAFGTKSSDVKAKADFGIVLGGDGALLQSARFLYPQGTPIFGINLGHMGLLTEFGAEQIPDVVNLFYEGRYTLEERLMVYAEIKRNDQLLDPMVALNDIVVSKGALSRMLRLRTSIDGQLVLEYPADGLIVSSPTGSTAYSLSAGGPIIAPTLSTLVVTPICAHSIFAKPLIVGGNSEIEVTFAVSPTDAMLTADGQVGVPLAANDIVYFKAAPDPTRFIRFKKHGFYEALRDRVKEGKL
ncbi:MAG TPA: NAD(+)/NADH kinase [Bacillota bacterium]|nr:NAD(+)/NADH kinase [Bacillota bacterium]